MGPLGLSAYALAKNCRVPRIRIERLARYLGTSAQFWMNLQSAYELVTADSKAIDQISPREAA